MTTSRISRSMVASLWRSADFADAESVLAKMIFFNRPDPFAIRLRWLSSPWQLRCGTGSIRFWNVRGFAIFFDRHARGGLVSKRDGEPFVVRYGVGDCNSRPCAGQSPISRSPMSPTGRCSARRIPTAPTRCSPMARYDRLAIQSRTRSSNSCAARMTAK